MDDFRWLTQALQDERRNTRRINGYECDECGRRFRSWARFKDHLPCD